MRNLKKLLAVVVAICVLATFTVPAFAADTTTTTTTAAKTADVVCTDLGMIKGAGNGVTADYLATQPDRLQAAIMFLRLKGLEDAAKAFVGTDNFADVEGLNDTNTAILAYLKANPDLGFAGIGDNKFAPLEKMTAKAYVKVMLVALGYVYEKDFTWANVFSFAASKGMSGLVDNEAFTVKDLCTGTVEALKATVKGGTDTLIAKLVEGGSVSSATAVASGLFTATAKALEVVSATTDTLKTAKIVFNKELNSDTVTAANFYNSGATATPKLLDDKKTVLVIFDSSKAQSATADIVISASVKAVDGTALTKVTKTVTFVDTTIPVISGVVAKNAKTLVISANEPIDAANVNYKVWSEVKIDGTAAVGTSSVDFAKNTLTINLASIMATGAHKIDISGLKDFASYTAVATTFNVDVAADTTAPAIASAKVNSPTEVEVTFSEDVDNLNQGSFWVNGNAVASATQSSTDKSKFTLTFTTPLDIGATVEIKVQYQNQKDVVGNKVSDKTTYTFKTADDTALPTVAITMDGSKIVLTFSKAMLKTAGTVKVYKASDNTQLGTSISLSGLAWDSSTVVKIPATAGSTGLDNTDAKDIKVNVTGCKDATIRANALAETNATVKAPDSKKPTVYTSYTVEQNVATDLTDDTITFYFSEAVDADTAKNLSNYVVTTPSASIYTVANQALAAYSDVSFSSIASDGKSVTIKAKDIYAQKPGITVYALKDIAGNMMVTGSASAASTTGPSVSSAKATANNTVEVVFDQSIGYFAPGAFILTEGTNGVTLSAAVIAGSIDDKKVTMTLDRSIGTVTDKACLTWLDNSLVKNAYSVKAVTTASFQITDAIAPTVSFAATSAGIDITFSEDVTTSASTLTNEITLLKGTSNVIIDGTTIRAIQVSTKAWRIVGLAVNTDYTISIAPKSSAGTQDAATNVIAKTDATTVTTKE